MYLPFTHTRHALLTADLQRAPGAEKRYYQTHQSKEITHFELMTNWNIFFRSHSLLSLRGHSITMWTRRGGQLKVHTWPSDQRVGNMSNV